MLPELNLFFFVGLVLVMAGLTLLAIGRAGRVYNESVSISRRWMSLAGAGLVLWLGIPFVLAKKGILADFSLMPSPITILLFTFTFMTVLLSTVSPFGKRLAKGLSFHTLFGFQVFRIAIEILLMLLHKQGLAPIQVTLEGRNWDILTGVLALGVLVFFKNKPPSRTTYMVLNLIGLGLVLNVMIVSALSLPSAFQLFMNDNSWITQAPFVWLPTFLVQLAIAGHLLSFRKLLRERQATPMTELAKAS